jgi:hypothetical protein
MSAWGNTDNHNQKPKWDVERETREVIQLTVLTGNTAGNNIIQVAYNDGGQNNVANIGVATGQYVYFWAQGTSAAHGGQSGNGVPGMFASNTQVGSISGNTITLAQNLFDGGAPAGFIAEFDKSIVYNTNKPVETTYNADTLLLTPSRMANSNNQFSINGSITSAGWVHYQRKVNSDGTVRIIPETLVALANPVAANTSSGNTSFTQLYTGV